MEWRFCFHNGENECGEIPANPLSVLPNATSICRPGFECYLRLVDAEAQRPTVKNIHFTEVDRTLFVRHSGNESREAKPDDEESQEVIRKIANLYADGL